MFTRSRYLLAAFSSILILGLHLSCSKETSENQIKTEATNQPDRRTVAKLDREIVLADSLLALADTLVKQSKFDSSFGYFEKAGAIYEKLAAQSNDLTAWEKFLKSQNGYCAVLYRKGNFNQAIQLAEKNLALGLNKLGKMNAQVARTYDVLGVVYCEKGLFDKALEYENEAVVIRKKVLPENHIDMARSYHNLALIHMRKGLLDSALVLYQRALAIRLQILGRYHFDVAANYNNIGLVYQDKGDAENALAGYENALEIALKMDNQYLIGNFYNNLARIYSAKGDQYKAIELYRKSMATLSAIWGSEHPDIARSHLNIASAYQSLLDHDNALPHLRLAIEMWRKKLGDKHPLLAVAYNNLGNIHLYEYANYDSAFNYYNKALKIRLDALGKEHRDVGEALQSIGGTYLQMGKSSQAIEYYNRALKIYLKTPGNKSFETGSTYKGLGDAYLQQKRFDQAFANYQKSLIALVYDFEDTSISVNPTLDNVVSKGYLGMTLVAKAKAFALLAEQPQQRARRVDDLKMTLTTYEKYLELVEKFRRDFKTEEARLYLATELTKALAHAIATTLESHRLTQNEEYYRKAFHYAEFGKTSILLESLREADAKQFAGIPDSLLEKERRLRVDLSYHNTQLQLEKLQKSNRDSLKIAGLEDRRFGLNQQYEVLLEKFERDFPRYYALKYQTTTVSIAEIQELLDEQTALVEYVTGDSTVYIFIVSKNDFKSTVVPIASPFQEQVEVFLSAITQKDYARYVKYASRLFAQLLNPVREIIAGKNLLIIPDGVLSYLPFEALLTQEAAAGSSNEDYRTLPYLMETYAISYAYSASLWLETQRQRREAAENDFVAFAPVFPNGVPAESRAAEWLAANLGADSTRASLAALPMTRDEVLSIKKLFDQKAGFAGRWMGRLFGQGPRIYLEGEASEKKFKSENLSNYPYVHLATHGFANRTTPDLSGLAFAVDPDTSEDDVLYLREIYNLKLNADLVVLGACESGIGKLSRGEGLMGLSRGFIYAGTKNLLVSLWQVNDASTATLMREFYAGMLAGRSKADALRQAKLHLIQAETSNPKFAMPYYWAPFILIGQ